MNQKEAKTCCICQNTTPLVKFAWSIKVDILYKPQIEKLFSNKVCINDDVCDKCQSRIENRNLISTCVLCQEETTNILNKCDTCLNNTSYATDSSMIVLTCPLCSKKFENYNSYEKHLKITHKKKEITLEEWKSLNLENLTFVEKKEYSSIHPSLIEEYLFEKKIPLVFQNSLGILKEKSPVPLQFNENSTTFDLLSLDFLKEKFGDADILPRDTDALVELPGWKMKDYVKYLRTPIHERKIKHLYGKDLPCPVEWSSFLFKNEKFPEICVSFGKYDCFASLDKKIQPLTLLNYIGMEGTNTPGHKDICASIGNNIMVDVQDKNSISIWKLFHPKDYELVEKYLKFFFQSSLEHDNCFMTTTFLAAVPFQTIIFEQRLGDYIIIPPNSPHQVENIGGFTTKIAWNTLLPRAIPLSYETLEIYRSIGKQQIFRIKAIAYYSLERLVNRVDDYEFDAKDTSILKDFPPLIDTITKIIQSEYILSKDSDEKFEVLKFTDELKHTRTCDYCKEDIWNRCYHCDKCEDEGVDFCLQCVSIGRGCKHRKELKLMEFISMKDMIEFLNKAKICYKKLSRLISKTISDPSIEIKEIPEFTPIENSSGTLSDNRIMNYHKEITRFCHQCKEKKQVHEIIECSVDKCGRYFCESCLWNGYSSKMVDCLKINWKCPACEKICSCDFCVGKMDKEKSLKRNREVESFNEVAIHPVDSSLVQSISDSSPNPNKIKKLNSSMKSPNKNSKETLQPIIIPNRVEVQLKCSLCSKEFEKMKRILRCLVCDHTRCHTCSKLNPPNTSNGCEHKFQKIIHQCDLCESHIFGSRFHTSNQKDFCEPCYLKVRVKEVVLKGLTTMKIDPIFDEIRDSVQL